MNKFKNKNENLDGLLAKFFLASEAKQVKDDFSFVDGAFEKFPAAKPAEQTIEEIKRKIAVKLSTQKHSISWPRVILQTAAVAAVVIAVAVLTWPDKPAGSIATKTQGQGIQLVSETDISLYEAEIAQLNSELLTLNYGEENGTNGRLLDLTEQVEVEIIETDNTFWKG
ncbi:MAG: hypothetical protein ACYC3B_05470 [Sedimentisphaerales bacterium]